MALSGVVSSINGQNTLLQENFNGSFPPAGWTVVESTLPGAVNHWSTQTLSERTYAYVQSPNYSQAEPVKEEILISPQVTLNGYYDLCFDWLGATAQSINKLPNNAEYDFQIRVREVGSDDWTTIFSFLDADMVRGAGVAFPWSAWQWNPSAINLTEWSGKTVEFAFVYCLLKAGPSSGNDLRLDDVSIVQSQQVNGPIAELSTNSYIFPTTYIGGKKYSESVTLKNSGKDVLTVSAVNGLDGTDFGTTIKTEEVSLKTGDTYTFQFWYAPTVDGLSRATATIVTNGGNVDVALTGYKKLVPETGMYEGFENEIFPPLGWSTQSSGWYRYGAGLTGDASAVCGFPDNSALISPRLDLSGSDDNVLQFTYFENFEPTTDDTTAPANYFKVYLSTDGGSAWNEIFNSETYEVNQINTISLELNGNKSDNCYVKFLSYIPGFSMSSYDDVPDYSLVFLDDVVLPSVYGSNMAPQSSTAVYPLNGAKDVYHKNLELKWTGQLFATNYKLYLGTSASNFDVINGQDMGTSTSYVVPTLEHGKTYYWKVVGYNGTIENTSAPVWNFTVMADQSVTSLPYGTNFDEGFPLGWNATQEGSTKWSLSNYQPYGGYGQSPYASGYQAGTSAVLESPEINLPASGQSLVSFVWGNAAPVGLIIDETGSRVNTTTSPGSQCCIFFDVEVDGVWKNLGMLHEEGETKYWYRESYDISQYAGKKVTFRWRYEVYDYQAASASVDNFLVETVSGDKAMVTFSMEEWNAGSVNNGASVTSRNPILLSNIGLEPLKISSVSFGKSNFSTDLAPGVEIAPNRSASFSVSYNAGTQAGEVTDNMVVAFGNGLSATFPVKGTTLEQDVYYYDFEGDEHTSTQPVEFTTVDCDGLATVQPALIYYEKRGAPFAFIVLNCTGQYADWRNVYPVSGDQVLASMGESTGNGATDDWIISSRMKATSQSNFRFYAKCYGDETQRFPQNYVEVLVSTSDAPVSKASLANNFETVMASSKIPWAGSEGKWTEYNVDLSKYSGSNIRVALRHTTDKGGFVSFFDDFWFEHFDGKESGVDNIAVDSAAGSEVLYNLNGVRIDRNNAAPGIYIRRSNGKTEKIVIK